GRNRCSPMPAGAFPARDRPRDPRCHTTRSRMRGGLAPLQERLCGPTRPWALLRVLFSARIKAIDQVAEPLGNSLVYDLVIHCAQLLTQTRLNVSAQLCWFRIDFFATRRRRFHRILLSRGLSFVHCSPQLPRPGRAPVSPLVLCKTLECADGSS